MATFVLNTPCQAKRSREVTKEQTAYLYHRILTSAGYSASSVEKYHYHSDCHRHIRGNLILIAGVLAILKKRNHGVPAKVAIIRNKVLVNDLFNFQVKRLPFFAIRNEPLHSFGQRGMKCTPKIAAFQKILQKIFEIKKAACSG